MKKEYASCDPFLVNFGVAYFDELPYKLYLHFKILFYVF